MRGRVTLPLARAIAALAWLGLLAPGTAAGRDPVSRSTAAAKKSADTAEPTTERRRQLQSEQKQMQQRLSRLKRQLADAEASHSEASDDLAVSEAAISTANRRLRELAEARRQVERQIATLHESGRGVGVRQAAQEAQLGLLLRHQIVLTRDHPLRRTLAGRSPAGLGRERRYLEIAADARAASIVGLRERRGELRQQEGESLKKQAELADIAGEERRARSQLLRQQTARKRTLTRLARQISSQRQTIASLERDERRLSAVVEEINRVLAEQAKRAAQRAAAAARDSRSQPMDKGAATRLNELRGRLHLPVQGQITARFGSPRRTEAGVDAPTWKGVFIRAPEGADVRAVAAGRVVFADWLRGFGNLMIVDHGEGLLSVYGNNESLLRSVGDKVEAEEVVAAVGNTGGNPESGLYFELRYEGRPIDPLKWAQAR